MNYLSWFGVLPLIIPFTYCGGGERVERGACKYNRITYGVTHACAISENKINLSYIFYMSANTISQRIFESNGYRLIPTIN